MNTRWASSNGSTDICTLLPKLPLWARTLNSCGAAFRRSGRTGRILSVDSIRAEAIRRTGLSDWGEEDPAPALELLSQPDQPGATMTLIGRLAHRATLVDCLINRLRIHQEILQCPAILDERIAKPLIIAGMPRTGSTLLQRLLSQDHRCRPLLCWEAFHPAPAPRPETHATDPRIRETRRQLKRLVQVFPMLASMHYMSATTPEECEWLLHNSLEVPGFFAAPPEFPQFNAWCRDRDKCAPYRYYKRQLQILQRHFPQAHWVLKGNEHVGSMDALVEIFPDACIVQTHRNPQRAVASFLSLTLRLFGLKYRATEAFLAEAGQRAMQDYAQILDRSMEVRRQLGPDRCLDIHYPDLVTDPLGVVARIYDHFNYSFCPDTESRMKKWLEANPQAKHGVHRYSLEEFGLTAEAVAERFRPYCDHYHGSQSVQVL